MQLIGYALGNQLPNGSGQPYLKGLQLRHKDFFVACKQQVGSLCAILIASVSFYLYEEYASYLSKKVYDKMHHENPNDCKICLLRSDFMPTKSMSIRIDSRLLDKFHIVADYEDRSANGQTVVLIKQCVEEFEKEHGKIELGTAKGKTQVC